MTSRNMLKHLKCEDLVLAIDSTCKIYFNECPVHVLRYIDKQQRFYPIAFALSSNEDQFSHSTFFKSVESANKSTYDEELKLKHEFSYF